VQVLLEHGARDVAVLGCHITLERDHDPRGVRGRTRQGELQIEEVAAFLALVERAEFRAQ